MLHLIRSTMHGVLRPGIATGTAVVLAIAGAARQPPESVAVAGRGCVTPGSDGPNAALTGVVNSPTWIAVAPAAALAVAG
jgi:hypothetical protein